MPLLFVRKPNFRMVFNCFGKFKIKFKTVNGLVFGWYLVRGLAKFKLKQRFD